MPLTYNDSGWLFQSGKPQNIIRNITEEDINDLLCENQKETLLIEKVRQEVMKHDAALMKEMDSIDPDIEYLRMNKIGGTIEEYPYGHIITFPKREHLFRGENQIYRYSESTLSRKTRGKSPKDAELLHAVSNMRIVQFRKAINKINVVPYWEAKISDVNYKALAQHYGFDTYLLDLTNDFQIALFFATCKYEDGAYRPLTTEDINRSDESRYGVIFHTPDWTIDFMDGEEGINWIMRHKLEMAKQKPLTYEIDSGECDGPAYQIGLQPFYRCHYQSGYVFPMKTQCPLQDNLMFEKLIFPQSVELSERIYRHMHEGKDIYPNEGIERGQALIDRIKSGTVFSEDDLLKVYEFDGCDKKIFPKIESLKEALINAGYIV